MYVREVLTKLNFDSIMSMLVENVNLFNPIQCLEIVRFEC